jgi:hypothetical protein
MAIPPRRGTTIVIRARSFFAIYDTHPSVLALISNTFLKSQILLDNL